MNSNPDARKLYHRQRYQQMSEAERQRLLEVRRARRANMSEAEREAERAYSREYQRQRYAKMVESMSPEERVEYQKALYEARKIRRMQAKLNKARIAQKEK